LPCEPFSPKKVAILTVQRNYHVQLSDDYRYYSVPYQYVGKKVKVIYDDQTIEVYLGAERIALHVKSVQLKQTTTYSTNPEHRPPHHKRMLEIKGWNQEDLLLQASRIGPAAAEAANLILQNGIYMEQNYKSCFGMLMLQKKYGAPRLEMACTRVLRGSRVNYTMIKNILERGLDRQLSLPESAPTPDHENIRGKDEYR
jgi:hypothetical protein